MRVFRKTQLVPLILAFLTLPVGATAAPQDESFWDHYESFFKAKFPIQRDLGPYVGYRYSHVPVPGDLEYSFVIGFLPRIGSPELEKTLTADFRLADTASIYEQMKALHLENPRESIDDLRIRVKVKFVRLTEKECPAMRTQFEKFKKLQFGVPNFETISLDAPTHEFQIRADGLMNLNLGDEHHPLVEWALETRRALESCSTTATSGPKN